MEITKVTTKEHESYIPLKGWDSVERALILFEQGASYGSFRARTQALREVEVNFDGLALGYALLASAHTSERGSQLVRDILKNAKRAVVKGFDHVTKSYDYEAMNTPFFKSIIDIVVLDQEQELYGLGLSDCNGKEIEIGLADYLKIPRTLVRTEVVCETSPTEDGTQFVFDFDKIMPPLNNLLGTSLDGASVAQLMLDSEPFEPLGEDRAHVGLTTIDTFSVVLAPSQVERRRFFPDDRRQYPPRPIDTRSVSGSKLYGRLMTDYTTKQPAAPSFAIGISRKRENKLGWTEIDPIWQPNEKQAMRDLTQKIADALRPR